MPSDPGETDATQLGRPVSSPTDATVSVGAAGTSSQPSAEPVTVRSGVQRDYPGLVTVERTHYVVADEIARGGMGRIFTARDRRLGRTVAIKELLVSSDELRVRFEREARITANLQHPAIVNLLEAGTWPTGEPFYVMKLVTGEPLDKVIASKATLGERLSLLPNIITVVEALAYAHGRRIIHRDLKPANILAGEFGETVVIDWGLAKELGTKDTPLPATPGGSAPGETMAGAIMGTPTYMPVEQATGRDVDERADVYALGAILYHLLAGVAPYRGKTVDDILAQVRTGPPRPLAELAPDAPPDLVTIVGTAMAYDAADRYATAKELAGELKQFQTGQLIGSHRYTIGQLARRWVRKNRVAVMVGGVLLAFLAVTILVSVNRVVDERDLADAQRTIAETNQRDSEELLDFMLGDLRDQLVPLGKLELLDKVAMKASAYYQGRPAQAGDDELGRRARMLANVGDVVLARGHVDDALVAQRDALAIRERLTASSASDERRLDEAVAHVKISNVLVAKGDGKGALVELERARDLAQAIADRDPNAVRAHDLLADAQRSIGDVQRTGGDLPRALTAYRAALAIEDVFAAKAPDDALWKHHLSVTHTYLAYALQAQGNLADAEPMYRRALVEAEQLAASAPSDTKLQRDVAASHDDLGDVLDLRGDLTRALAEYRTGTAIYTRLAERDVTDTGLQRLVGGAHSRTGQVLLRHGDTAGAVAEFRAAEAIRTGSPTSIRRTSTGSATSRSPTSASATRRCRPASSPTRSRATARASRSATAWWRWIRRTPSGCVTPASRTGASPTSSRIAATSPARSPRSRPRRASPRACSRETRRTASGATTCSHRTTTSAASCSSRRTPTAPSPRSTPRSSSARSSSHRIRRTRCGSAASRSSRRTLARRSTRATTTPARSRSTAPRSRSTTGSSRSIRRTKPGRATMRSRTTRSATCSRR